MTNGAGRRKLVSWIDAFVEYTSELEASPTFRRWSAISTIAAALERKVWVFPNSPLYPNLYVFLVGHAGIGKSRTIHASSNFIRQLPEPLLSPTSMTMASLVDVLVESKRVIVRHPDLPLDYNTLYIVADELSAFMHDYKNSGELIAGLTTFYDCGPYGQARRVNDIRAKIDCPQLNILTGSTPSNLMKLVPDYAWDQGLMSRIILIYSDERPLINIFESLMRPMPTDMIHDIKIINTLSGLMNWTEEYVTAMHNWKLLELDPAPKHPKLEHYCARRYSHLIKLSMVACVDRGSDMRLSKADFNKAMGWLLLAEQEMPKIFAASAGGMDSKAIDEIHHYIEMSGDKGISEHQIINYARMHIQYASNAPDILTLMEKSGLVKVKGIDKKTGLRWFTTT